MKKSSGEKTLFWSVAMSAPGPLILAFGLLIGKSSTQLADFFRRSAELLAILMSYIVYKVTRKEKFSQKKEKLEYYANKFAGTMMCLSGSLMIIVTFFAEEQEKGNVLPGLCIAALGLIANSIFHFRYVKINKLEPDPIIAVQSRLYRAKALVDGCVTTALLSVALLPQTQISYWLDTVGSLIVSIYLIFCGIQTLKE